MRTLLTRSVLVSIMNMYYFNHIGDAQTLCHRNECLYIVKTVQQLKIDKPHCSSNLCNETIKIFDEIP